MSCIALTPELCRVKSVGDEMWEEQQGHRGGSKLLHFRLEMGQKPPTCVCAWEVVNRTMGRAMSVAVPIAGLLVAELCRYWYWFRHFGICLTILGEVLGLGKMREQDTLKLSATLEERTREGRSIMDTSDVSVS
jgi:hypothetical protein